jgi:hypothetical protein
VFLPTRTYFDNCDRFFDRFFANILAIGYLLALTIPSPAQQEWYVFRTKAEEKDFQNDYDYSTNWCDALEFPVFLTYSQPLSASGWIQFANVIPEVALFCMSVYALRARQAGFYSWMDPDSYMNHKNRTQCSYYGIHENRNRVFNELMIEDWIVANVEGPLIKSILTDDQYKFKRDMMSKAELEKLQGLSDSIDEKTMLSRPA